AAQKIFLPDFYVAEARNINSVGTIAERNFVFVARHGPAGASAHVMVHQIVAKLAAAVGKAIGKFRGGGIEKDARGFQSGGAEKNNTALKFDRRFALRDDYARPGNAPG